MSYRFASRHRNAHDFGLILKTDANCEADQVFEGQPAPFEVALSAVTQTLRMNTNRPDDRPYFQL